jgi:alkaline phosphatase
VYGTSSDTFGGLIDEVAIWDSDQSSNLSTIYNSRVPADLSALSPLSWWRMGETNPDSAGTAVALITDVQGRNNFAQADASKQPVLSTDVAS